MYMEQCWSDTDRKTDGKKSCTNATFSTTNSEWKDLWPDEAFRGDSSAIEALSYGTTWGYTLL